MAGPAGRFAAEIHGMSQTRANLARHGRLGGVCAAWTYNATVLLFGRIHLFKMR